jgi:hypothetical protein
VGISLRVLTHPDLENLPKIHREVGPDFRDRVLPSLGNEIMKAVVAQYNAEQLLTEREGGLLDPHEQLGSGLGREWLHALGEKRELPVLVL